MSKFQEGDPVEAVNGETRIVARLEARDGGLFFTGWGRGTNSAECDGFTLTLIERPVSKVELPTEPGVYLGSVLRGMPMWLTADGHWYTAKSRVYEPERHAPFTKLEPVSVTAEKVLDAVKADIHPGHMGTSTYSHVEACISHVGHQFGVTE